MICEYCGKEIPIKSSFDRFYRIQFNVKICSECVEEYSKQLRNLKRKGIDICESLRSTEESSS
jgi:hypothetical protein